MALQSRREVTDEMVERAAKVLSYKLEYEGRDWDDFFAYDWGDQGEARQRWRVLALAVLDAALSDYQGAEDENG